jgi:hypothetical protein
MCYNVVTVNSYHIVEPEILFVRRVKSRGTGPYFQLVRSYREGGKVKQEVLAHLGEHPTPEEALVAWPSDVEHMRAIGRNNQADKLAAKLDRLRKLTKGENDAG